MRKVSARYSRVLGMIINILFRREVEVIAIKYAKEIVKEIRERGSIMIPDGCDTGDAFEEWLRKEGNFVKTGDAKGIDRNTGKRNLVKGAIDQNLCKFI